MHWGMPITVNCSLKDNAERFPPPGNNQQMWAISDFSYPGVGGPEGLTDFYDVLTQRKFVEAKLNPVDATGRKRSPCSKTFKSCGRLSMSSGRTFSLERALCLGSSQDGYEIGMTKSP